MKAQTKAIVASVVVIALALTAVSGVTYSWWSDSENSTIDISTGGLDVSITDYIIKENRTTDGTPVEKTINPTKTENGLAFTIDSPAGAITTSKFSISYTAIFRTTVDAKYFISASCPDQAWMSEFKVSAKDVNGSNVEVGSWNDLEPLGTPLDVNVEISFDVDVDSCGSFATVPLMIKNQITQKESIVDSTNGTATVPSSNPVISGAPQNNAGSKNKIVNIEADFNEASSVKGKEVTITSELVSSSGFKVDGVSSEPQVVSLSLPSGETFKSGEKVRVTVKLEGVYSDPTVAYLGEGEAPTDIVYSIVDENGKKYTYVSFSTTHFSKFAIIDGKVEVEVSSPGAFFGFLSMGFDVKLGEDIEYTAENVKEARLYVGSIDGQTLNLNNKNVTVFSAVQDPTDKKYDGSRNHVLFFVNGKFTVEGEGKVTTTMNDCTYCLYGFDVVKGGHLSIRGGEYFCGGTVVQLESGKISESDYSMDCTCSIYSGKFEVAPYDEPYGYRYMLNYLDALYKNATEKNAQLMNVYGGIFTNYDPSDSASENPRGGFLAEGCVAVSNTSGSEIIFTIYTDLNSALSDVKSGERVGLGPGEFSLIGTPCDAAATGDGGITVAGAGANKTRLVITDNMQKATWNGSSVNFVGITLVYSNDGYTGIQHSGTMTYAECIIEGCPFLYAETEKFEGCTFNQTQNDTYCVWTYGAKSVEFKDCIFNGTNKAVLLYTEKAEFGQSAVFEGCKFNASNPEVGKAAVEIHTECGPIYTVTIEDCSTTGFGNGSISGSSLWNEKGGRTSTVTVDGTVVWNAGVVSSSA